MAIWHHFFDSDYYQRRDIEMLRQQIDDGDPIATAALDETRSLSQRVDRLELLVDALMELAMGQGVSADAIQLMVQRLDLADGFEDGRLGPERSAEAPKCGGCGRPVNPKRNQCIYCDAPISEMVEVKVEPRILTCSRCTAQVAETTTYFTESGLVCTPCYNQPDTSSGGLSLSQDRVSDGAVSLPDAPGEDDEA